MDDIRDALLRMVRVARKAYKVWDTINAVGYDMPIYFDIAGDVADAIYRLIGERTEMFTLSTTYKALRDEKLSDEKATAILMQVYRRNHGMPKPNLLDRKAFRESVKRNGGYIGPEKLKHDTWNTPEGG